MSLRIAISLYCDRCGAFLCKDWSRGCGEDGRRRSVAAVARKMQVMAPGVSETTIEHVEHVCADCRKAEEFGTQEAVRTTFYPKPKGRGFPPLPGAT